MLKKLIFASVVLFLALGVKAALERQASRMLGVAEEMYEDGEYEKALEQLRSLETWLSWTKASKGSLEFREEVRASIVEEREGRERKRSATAEANRRSLEEREEQRRQGDLDRVRAEGEARIEQRKLELEAEKEKREAEKREFESRRTCD